VIIVKNAYLQNVENIGSLYLLYLEGNGRGNPFKLAALYQQANQCPLTSIYTVHSNVLEAELFESIV